MMDTWDGIMETVRDEQESYDSDEDSYSRREAEDTLYSQLYHSFADHSQSENLTPELKMPVDESPNAMKTQRLNQSEEKNNFQAKIAPFSHKSNTDMRHADENSVLHDDIQITKEMVKIDDGASSSTDIEMITPIHTNYLTNKLDCVVVGKRTRKEDSSTDDDEDMPFWSRLDSGHHLNDVSLDINMSSNERKRKRNDSIISRTSSCLGDDDEKAIVSLDPNYYNTLEDLLATLPDDGWEILGADCKMKGLDLGRTMRYHNLKCRNCSRTGHLSSVCPEAKKAKRCTICAGVHDSVTSRHGCPERICLACRDLGHDRRDCRRAKFLRSIHCQRCKSRGHKVKHCHELWRQWHSTTETTAVYPADSKRQIQRNNVFCANCGYNGHFVFECKMLEWWQLPALSPTVGIYDSNKKHSESYKRYRGAEKQVEKKKLKGTTKKNLPASEGKERQNEISSKHVDEPRQLKRKKMKKKAEKLEEFRGENPDLVHKSSKALKKMIGKAKKKSQERNTLKKSVTKLGKRNIEKNPITNASLKNFSSNKKRRKDKRRKFENYLTQ